MTSLAGHYSEVASTFTDKLASPPADDPLRVRFVVSMPSLEQSFSPEVEQFRGPQAFDVSVAEHDVPFASMPLPEPANRFDERFVGGRCVHE